MMPAVNDHDLLVRLDTKMDVLTASIGKLETSVAAKADAERVTKVEAEVSTINRKIAAAGGAVAVLEIILRLIHV